MRGDKVTVVIGDDQRPPNGLADLLGVDPSRIHMIPRGRLPFEGLLLPNFMPAMLGAVMNGSEQERDQVVPQSEYFVTERKIIIDDEVRQRRIKQLSQQEGCSEKEATHRINAIILTEMLAQVRSPEDLSMVRAWAEDHIS